MTKGVRTCGYGCGMVCGMGYMGGVGVRFGSLLIGITCCEGGGGSCCVCAGPHLTGVQVGARGMWGCGLWLWWCLW